MRIGSTLGIVSSLLGISALFLTLVSFSVVSTEGIPVNESHDLSIYDCLSNARIGLEAQEAFEKIFNYLLLFSIAIGGFSFWSNSKPYAAILTLIISIIHLAASVILYVLGPKALNNLSGLANFHVGIGMYVLILAGILGVSSAILALLKK
jgi:hypothetical protein